jgi:hypothetical protein
MLGVTAMLAALLLGASPSFAATSYWTISKTHVTVWANGNYGQNTFQKAQTSLPPSPVITSTVVTVTPYSNGFTTDTVQICYWLQYTSTDYICYANFNITSTTTRTISSFNGQSAKGTVVVRHYLTGGTYPAYGGTAQDSVTVNYQY